MTPTRDDILARLDRFTHPRTGKGLVTEGVARAVSIDAGKVQVVLDVDATDAAAMQDLPARIEAALLAMSGVVAASVLLTAERSTTPPPDPRRKDGPQKVAGVARIIAVGSGKGGVGKSTVSANLALALADQGLKVGLLDADIYGPSVPMMMGSTGRPIGRENKLIPIAAHGIKVMSVGFLMEPGKALVWRGPILANAIQQLLHDVDWAPLDVLVVDLPPGTGDVQITLTQKTPIDGAIIVTTPQDVALLDARRAIDMFHQTGTPLLGLIENMSTHICAGCGLEDNVFGHGGGEAEAEAQGIAFLGALPLTRQMREASDSGTPVVRLYPDSTEAERFAEIAARLTR